MSKVVEMLGKTYGELTVIEEFSRTNNKKCVCQCSCGKVVEKSRRDVKSGNTKSCGCLKKRLAQERYTKDLTGLRFGKLVVKEIVRDYDKKKSDGAYWRCVCDCGNEKITHRRNLKSGLVQSCGCLKKEKTRQRTESLVGKQFGDWVVIQDFASKDDSRCVVQCSCGEVSYSDRHNLTSGRTQGCKKCKGERKMRKHKYDNIGLTQGRLTIVDVDEEYNYICKCSCGTVKTISKSNWNQGVRSCGCYKTDNARELYTNDLKGKTFGKVKVLAPIYRDGKNPKWDCECECGNRFETYGQTLKAGSGMCPKCWAKHNSGENNPSWNPNLTDEDRANNRCSKEGNQEDWRKQVYERDDYTCQCCGQRGGRLNAHHLDGYNWCVEGRFDVGNGATLCENCHKTFHKKYGYKNNTSQQFKEFMGGH